MDAITQTLSQLVHAVLGTLQQKLKAQNVRILFTTWESDTAKYEGNNTHAVIPDNIKIICHYYYYYHHYYYHHYYYHHYHHHHY